MSMMHELSRIQEVIEIITEHTKDPTTLPQSGEQVLADLKASSDATTNSIYQVCMSTCRVYVNISSSYIIIIVSRDLEPPSSGISTGVGPTNDSRHCRHQGGGN